MKHPLVRLIILFSATFTFTDSAYSQQPPDVVQSDINGNTAMGFNALLSNVAVAGVGGNYNTAAGYDAMSLNVSGSESVAFGYGALNHNISGNRNAAFGDDALFFNSFRRE